MTIVNEAARRSARAHVLLYEPRTEGHHLTFLKHVTEDLLAAGYRLTLAIDVRPEPFERIRAEMADLLKQVSVIPVGNTSGGLTGSGKAASVAGCLTRAGADLAFLDTFDEIGSAVMRRAAVGLMPPVNLHGRLAGIYHRPRFLESSDRSVKSWIKAVGFRRLLCGGWFSHLLLVDPYLHAEFKSRQPDAPVFYLPDAYPDDFTADREQARQQFGLPRDKRAFLFYGVPHRRKGLPLVIEAMLAMSTDTPAFLICAGRQPEDARVAAGIAQLASQGRACVIDRYVTTQEEKQLFAAADVVLLPYRKHYGGSGVLVRAVGAGVPVVASDEGLLGRFVRDYALGLLFRSGDLLALRASIERMALASPSEMSLWQAAARAVAPLWSRQAFRDALLGSFTHCCSVSEIEFAAKEGHGV